MSLSDSAKNKTAQSPPLPVAPQMVILKANSYGMRPAEIFLRNRGVEFVTTASLKEAIALIVRFKPRYVLLAADHPNRKIRTLPKLLTQAFQVVVVGFTENSTPASLFSLQELNPQYVLYPPVSGPAIVRMMARVEKDLERNFMVSNVEAGHLASLLELAADPFSQITTKPVQLEAKALAEASAALMPGVMKSMQFLEQVAAGPANEKVGVATRLSCLSIENSKVQGYLLVALGNNRPMDAELLAMIRKNLDQVLGNASSPEPYEINVQEVEFSTWASAQAQFLLKSVHGGQEVAVAFFATPEVSFKWELSADGRMAQVAISEVLTESPLEFDLFVYLPENQKYVLYNKKGRTMFDQQKKRLQERGVTHVHCALGAVEDVRKQRAQQFVNGMIQAT